MTATPTDRETVEELAQECLDHFNTLPYGRDILLDCADTLRALSRERDELRARAEAAEVEVERLRAQLQAIERVAGWWRSVAMGAITTFLVATVLFAVGLTAFSIWLP